VSESFNSSSGLILIRVVIHGPTRSTVARLALDSGATTTLINQGPLVWIGYDPSLAPERVQVTTGSGVEFAPRLPLLKISALGCSRGQFPVLAHTLPPSATVDGLLGLDFFRGTRLEIDFRQGLLNLEN